MPEQLIFSFPHMGNYHIILKGLIEDLYPGAAVLPPPPITSRTLELGARYSPDFVCAPFKYNLGNFIEALDAGANVLLQTGTGCRFAYYGEVQKQILQDLGYDFTMLCLARENARPRNAYQLLQLADSKLNPGRFSRAFGLAIKKILLMDEIENYIRQNVGFETVPGSFTALHSQFLQDLGNTKTFLQISTLHRQYMKLLAQVSVNMPAEPLCVGIVGELYTLMEPFSNFYIERELAKSQIKVSRIMSATFLLLGKKDKKSLRQASRYLKYPVGANGVDSVAQCKQYFEAGYDGVIHMKSYGCTPEINAMPALQNLSRDYSSPVMHLSFDTQLNETGIQTRLEAFVDMIRMRKGILLA